MPFISEPTLSRSAESHASSCRPSVPTRDHRIRGEKGLYHVASYQLSDAKLEIKLLNEKLVDDELKKSAELTRALLEHKENKNLFVNPVKFRRIK